MCSEYDVYDILAVSFWRRARVGWLPALAHCLPFGRVHETARMGSAGARYKWFGAELGRCGSAGLRGPASLLSPRGGLSEFCLSEGGGEGMEPREGVWLMSARLGSEGTSALGAVAARRSACGGCQGRLGGPTQTKTCQTSRRGSQQHLSPGHSCVSH